MRDSRRALQRWEVDDEITAQRLNHMQELAAAAQLYCGSKNVHLSRAVNGGTAIAVDDPQKIASAGAVLLSIGDQLYEETDSEGGAVYDAIIDPKAAKLSLVTPSGSYSQYDPDIVTALAVDWTAEYTVPLAPAVGLKLLGGQYLGVPIGSMTKTSADPEISLPAFAITPAIKRNWFDESTGQWKSAYVMVPHDDESEAWWTNHWVPDILGSGCPT